MYIMHQLKLLFVGSLLLLSNPGSYLPPGPPNGTHKPGVHPAGYPMPRAPLSPFHNGPLSQPYAIPTRGAVHGPVGAVPHVPQPGSRGFGAGRGNAGTPIGSHLPHQQGTQQNVGNLGSNFNFPALENPNSQPSVGGPLSQPGFVNNVRIFLLVIARFTFEFCTCIQSHVVSICFFWYVTDASSRAKPNIS